MTVTAEAMRDEFDKLTDAQQVRVFQRTQILVEMSVALGMDPPPAEGESPFVGDVMRIIAEERGKGT